MNAQNYFRLYILFIVLPLLFLFGKMSERQIVNPNFISHHVWSTSVNIRLGNEVEARNAVQEILRIDPLYTMNNAQRIFTNVTGDEYTKKFVEYGIPECA